MPKNTKNPTNKPATASSVLVDAIESNANSETTQEPDPNRPDLALEKKIEKTERTVPADVHDAIKFLSGYSINRAKVLCSYIDTLVAEINAS